MVTPSYHSKVTPTGDLHAQNIAEAVLLHLFRIAFPASLLWKHKVKVVHFKQIIYPIMVLKYLSLSILVTGFSSPDGITHDLLHVLPT